MTSNASHAPVVVVGGGTAGSVLAARLSEDPARRVLLLEAGADHTAYDADILDPARAHLFRWLDAHGVMWPTTRPASDAAGTASVAFGGRVLGGTSAVNFLATVRGQPGDYDAWGELGLPGWSWADVRAAFVAAEHDLDLAGHELHGDCGPLTVRRWTRDEQAPVHRAFEDGLRELGVPHAPDLNDPACLPGVGTFPATVDPATGERLTVSRAYLTDAVRARPNLEIRCGVTVDTIVLDGDRAVGVRTRDGDFVAAAEVVVCAGAIASPVLLQRSGIGPKDVLAAAGVPVAVELPGVGANLQDHLGRSIAYEHDGPSPMTGSPAQTVWVDAGDDGPDIHVIPVPSGELDAATSRFTLLVYLMRCTARGSVTLTSADPGVPPLVRMPAVDEAGQARLARVYAVLDRWESTEAFRALGARRLSPMPGTAPEQDAGGFHSYMHMSGTCAMGPDGDPGAVLDATCAVRGVSGLRVVDASAMPLIPAGNTYLGCVMMAERVAALMRAG